MAHQLQLLLQGLPLLLNQVARHSYKGNLILACLHRSSLHLYNMKHNVKVCWIYDKNVLKAYTSCAIFKLLFSRPMLPQLKNISLHSPDV